MKNKIILLIAILLILAGTITLFIAGFEKTEIIKDWQGLDRVVCGQKPE